jgi:hypothetical protein
MIQGSKTATVTLKQSTVAIQRAQGMDVRTLALEYELSPNQMTQALIDMGYAKPRAGSKMTMKPKTDKELKFEAVCEKHSLTADQLEELLSDLGIKFGRKKVTGRKYVIINDVKPLEKAAPVVTEEEPQAESQA